jgi:transcriptional regulator with XRE-family HTH domain
MARGFDDDTRKRLADEIRRALGSRSQKWLAERLDVDQTTVSSWVRGQVSPRIERLTEIEEVLGLPAGHLRRIAVGDLAAETPGDYRIDPLMGKMQRLSARDRRAVERLVDDLLEDGQT